MNIKMVDSLVLTLTNRRPLKLVYFCNFMDIEQAINFEKKIKKWSQAKKKALIEGRFEDLPNLAKKLNRN